MCVCFNTAQWRTHCLIPVGTSELMTAELVIMQQSLNEVIQLVTSNTRPSVCVCVCWVSIRLKMSANTHLIRVTHTKKTHILTVIQLE